MNIRTPLIATAIALALASTAAFAAQPMDAGALSAAVAPDSQALRASDTGPIVATARKVYAFDALDRNHNGQLSRAELPRQLVTLRRDFVRADFNHNGQLSREEIRLFQRGEAPEYVDPDHAYIFVNRRAMPDLGVSMAP